MFRNFFRLLLTVSLVLIFSVSVSADQIDWQRFPHQAWPKMQSPPQIDGVVDQAEWLTASQLGPMKVSQDGVDDGIGREVFVAYDQDNLYIAFRFNRPATALKPFSPSATGRFDHTIDADMVEIMFSPDLDFDHSYAFWLYPNGAYGEALAQRGKVSSWNCDWQQKTRLTKSGWEGELAILFKAFGLDGPPSSEKLWGFDIVDNRKTPFKLLAHWSYRGQLWHGYENFGRIRFDPRVPAVRLTQASELGNGQLGVEFVLANATGSDVHVSTDIQLFKRKDGLQGGPKSYYTNLESGMSHDSQAEFTKDVNLEDQVKFARGFYEPVPDAIAKPSAHVQQNMRHSLGFRAPGKTGEYMVAYRILQDQQTVSSGITLFRVQPPLALKLEPYWLKSQVIRVIADLDKVDRQTDALAKLTIENENGDILSQSEATVKADALVQSMLVSTKGLKPDYYRVRMKLLDQAGQLIVQNTQPIHKPQTPVWLGNDFGNRTVVPKPWTPIKADSRGHVSMWGRSYDLSSVWPSTVTTNGKSVLPEPVRLLVTSDQKLLDWQVKQLDLQSTNPGRAVYQVQLHNSHADIAGTMTIDFDGMVWYDLKLTFSDSSLDLDSVVLDIPVAAEYAQLFGRHKFHRDPVIHPRQPVADRNGHAGRVLDSLMPFTPYLWLGDENAGMGWTAEAPIDWHNENPNACLQIVPASSGGQPARMRIHMVDSKLTIEKPMRLAFGLQATPIRAMPEHQTLNIFQKNGVYADEKIFTQLQKAGCKTIVFYYSWRGNSKTEMGGTPERPVDPAQQKQLKEAVEMAHKHGFKVIMFTGWGVNATSPNWQQFSYELGKYPIQNKGWGTFAQASAPNGAYVDFMAYGHADLAREYKVDGVLWDSTSNLAPDCNLLTGNAWVDREGHVRQKYPVLATRDLYRRIYNIYKSEERTDGIIYNHGGSLWPINVYADLLNRGEGRPMVAPTILDGWHGSLHEFRSEYSGIPFGVQFTGENNDFARLPMRVSTHLSVFLLQGGYPKEYSHYATHWSYQYKDRPIMALWQIFDDLPYDQHVKATYYFQNQPIVDLSNDQLLASSFVSGDRKRAIVVISNLHTDPADNVTAKLNFDVMGLKGNAFQIHDAMLRKPLDAQQGTLQLDIQAQRYRILKVQAK